MNNAACVTIGLKSGDFASQGVVKGNHHSRIVWADAERKVKRSVHIDSWTWFCPSCTSARAETEVPAVAAADAALAIIEVTETVAEAANAAIATEATAAHLI